MVYEVPITLTPKVKLSSSHESTQELADSSDVYHASS
jgi:hypothetical protein